MRRKNGLLFREVAGMDGSMTEFYMIRPCGVDVCGGSGDEPPV
jgi:hypothetical protein